MATRYRYAPEVEKVARELIREHHSHLIQTEIKFVFTDKAQRRAGKETWGTARKIGSLAAFLAGQEEDGSEQGTFFVISITEPVWNYLPSEKRRALVDHELCHCWVECDDEGNSKLILMGHDLEEFVQVIARHGLWRAEVQQFAEVAGPLLQHSLFDEATDPEAETSGDRNASQQPHERRGIVLGGPPRRSE